MKEIYEWELFLCLVSDYFMQTLWNGTFNKQFLDTRVTKRETLGLLAFLSLYLPLYYAAPAFYIALVAYGAAFVIVHKLLHIYPHVAKKYFWWHWNHHMHNQNKSWNVVFPLMDWITGTLEERQDES